MLPSFLPLAFALLTAAQESPIIVKLVPPKETGIADVLIGALGLSGALALLAAVLGVVVASVMFLVRSRHPFPKSGDQPPTRL